MQMNFLNKYKRYMIAVVLFVAFVFVLVNCTGPKSDTNPTQNGSETVATQATTEYELNGKLEKNASQELVDLITDYYTAYAAGDTESMEQFVSPFTDNEKSYIGALADYYENMRILPAILCRERRMILIWFPPCMI